MIYFTSYTVWPHPALMSSSLEDRLIPVRRDRFILTHFNIRQQVCLCPQPRPEVRSGLLTGNIKTELKLWWNWNLIKFSPPVFVGNFSKHKVSLECFYVDLVFLQLDSEDQMPKYCLALDFAPSSIDYWQRQQESALWQKELDFFSLHSFHLLSLIENRYVLHSLRAIYPSIISCTEFPLALYHDIWKSSEWFKLKWEQRH